MKILPLFLANDVIFMKDKSGSLLFLCLPWNFIQTLECRTLVNNFYIAQKSISCRLARLFGMAPISWKISRLLLIYKSFEFDHGVPRQQSMLRCFSDFRRRRRGNPRTRPPFSFCLFFATCACVYSVLLHHAYRYHLMAISCYIHTLVKADH
jgi:hypothetical protein